MAQELAPVDRAGVFVRVQRGTAVARAAAHVANPAVSAFPRRPPFESDTWVSDNHHSFQSMSILSTVRTQTLALTKRVIGLRAVVDAEASDIRYGCVVLSIRTFRIPDSFPCTLPFSLPPSHRIFSPSVHALFFIIICAVFRSCAGVVGRTLQRAIETSHELGGSYLRRVLLSAVVRAKRRALFRASFEPAELEAVNSVLFQTLLASVYQEIDGEAGSFVGFGCFFVCLFVFFFCLFFFFWITLVCSVAAFAPDAATIGKEEKKKKSAGPVINITGALLDRLNYVLDGNAHLSAGTGLAPSVPPIAATVEVEFLGIFTHRVVLSTSVDEASHPARA